MSLPSPFDTSEYIDTMDALISAEESHLPTITPTMAPTMASTKEETPDSANVAIAILLVCGAGLATSIGAAVVYVPKLVTLASPKKLAGSLGFSAGVMLFVSFVEIFSKSKSSFVEAGKSEDEAFGFAMICFLGGVLFMLSMNLLVERVMGGHNHSPGVKLDVQAPATNNVTAKPDSSKMTDLSLDSSEADCQSGGEAGAFAKGECNNPYCGQDDGWGTMICPSCQKGPAEEFATFQAMANRMEDYEKKKEEKRLVLQAGIPEATLEKAHPEYKGISEEEKKREENDKLLHMSIKSAIAIALHNFPEGLATFVAAVHDPSVGAVLAVAIALHNIPEGLCVSLPCYYATGNRRKAFLWGVLSGLSEPIAALLGWAILSQYFSHELYAVMFGVVSGMMVLISIRELLPTAHRYDPEDKVVTFCIVVGFIVMALSLGLFLV